MEVNFAVKVSCPELFNAVVNLGKRYGYILEKAGICETSPYIGFYKGQIEPLHSTYSYLSYNSRSDISYLYPTVLDAATQFNKIIEIFETCKLTRWTLGCAEIIYNNKKLTCKHAGETIEIPLELVEKIYKTIKKC